MLNDPNFGIGVGLTVLLLWLSHWLPKPHSLHPIARYTAGVAAILAGAGWWLVAVGLFEVAVGLVLLAFAAGVAVLLAYGYDALRAQPTASHVLRQLLDQEPDGRDD